MLRQAISTYNLFRLGAKLAPLLPLKFGNHLCGVIGLVIYYLLKSKRKAVLCNLLHVLPDYTESQRRRIAHEVFKSNIRNYYDLLRLHALTSEQRLSQIDLRNFDLAYEAFKRGKGIVAIAAHQGSFSFASQIATLVNFEFYLTVESVEPPELFEFVRKLREQDPRSHTIAVGKEGSGEIRTIFRALKDNHMVCIAIDRDVIGNGKPQLFFGAEAMLPTGAAEIALRSGATVLPVQTRRIVKGRHVLEFHPGFVPEATGDKAADIARVSAQMLREIEKLIRAKPEDWVVLDPIWPDC